MHKIDQTGFGAHKLIVIAIVSLLLISCGSTNPPRPDRDSKDIQRSERYSNERHQMESRVPQVNSRVYQQAPKKEKLRIRLTPAFFNKSPEHRIAVDLLHAMLQILRLKQDKHSLIVMDSNSTFNGALNDALSALGFSNDMNSNTHAGKSIHKLAFSVTPENTKGNTDQYTYLIKIGGIRIKRSYRVDNLRSQPVSYPKISGAQTRSIAKLRGLWG